MSPQRISRSPDLSRLRGEGFEVGISTSNLVFIRNVPYIAADRSIKRGMLVSELTLAGECTGQPGSHTMWFVGEKPCDKEGRPLQLGMSPINRRVEKGIVATLQFSQKRSDGKAYHDYHEKFSTYIAMIVGPVQQIDPSVTAQTYEAVEDTDPDSPFVYSDTATSRAGLYDLSQKIGLSRIVLIGLGGTGSYLLDFLAKCPIRRIDLYDGDVLYQHNPFRAPGAVPLDVLKSKPMKADYYRDIYSAMHRNIVSHTEYVDETNIDDLEDADFVFVCIDEASAKRRIFAALERFGIPFIDVGMGLSLSNSGVMGQLRATLSTPVNRTIVHANVSQAAANDDALYSENVQVADLNALNAVMAIIRFKKWCGFYSDPVGEHHSVFVLDDASFYHDKGQGEIDDAA